MGELLFDKCVNQLEESELLNIQNNGVAAGYGNPDDITRYFSGKPIYTAVHVIADARENEREYSPVHSHDFPELNILAAEPGRLVYRIRIGEEEHDVESPATIFIPPAVPHSANLVRGMGAFVVLRLQPEQVTQTADTIK